MISTYVLSKSLVSGSIPIPVTTLSTYVEHRLLQTDALAIAGAVSCLGRSAVHDTRAYLFFRADCDLSERMAVRPGSLEFCLQSLRLVIYSEEHVRESDSGQYSYSGSYIDHRTADYDATDGRPIRAVSRLFFVVCRYARGDDRTVMGRLARRPDRRPPVHEQAAAWKAEPGAFVLFFDDTRVRAGDGDRHEVDRVVRTI